MVEIKFLTDEDLQKFYKAIPEVKQVIGTSGISSKAYVKTLKPKDFQIMFRLMYGSGLRISEVVNLRTSDFDLKKKELTIHSPKGIQHTTILPSDISLLKKYLPTHNEKLFKISRETAWLYGKAIGKAANLNFITETKSRQVKGIFNQLFRESRKRLMQQEGALQELIDLKLRNSSDNDYGGHTIDDLKKWESKLEFLPSYGVVILGDVLGTKGIWKEKNVSDVIDKWNWVVTVVKNLLDTKNFHGMFTVKAFSDTIVILGEGDDIENLIIETGDFLKIFLALCLFYDFPIRGCFSIGQFVSSENLIIGPAVDEAASFYEKSDWIGFSATPSSYSVLERLESSKKYEQKLKHCFTKYDIPEKTGIDKQNWVVKIDPNEKLTLDINPSPTFKNMSLKDVFHYKLEHPVDPDGNHKWRNTFQYLQSDANNT